MIQHFTKLFLFILIITGCSSSQKTSGTVEEPLKPSWVQSRPIDNNYYVGIGVVSKQQFPLNYAEEAKRSALNELASEIQVNVSSNSMLFSLEDQGGFRDEFKSFTQLKTNANIQNYEQVGAYESSTQYWVYYRLSKEQYLADKQAKINQAIAESKVFYSESLTTNNTRLQLQQTIRSLEPISPYLNEKLETEWEGESVYWGNEIVKQIAALTSKLSLAPVNSSYKISWGADLQANPIQFVLKDESSRPVSNIPIHLTYSEGYLRPRIVKTDESGIVVANIDKMRSINTDQNVSAEIDLQTIYEEGTDEVNDLVVSLLSKLKTPVSTTYLSVFAPRVYVQVDLMELGKSSEANSLIKTAVESAFSDLGYTITSSAKNSELKVEVKANTQALNQSNGMYSCSLNGMLKVLLASNNKEVYTSELQNIKGVQLDYTKASNKAVERTASELSEVYIPRFHRAYLK